MRNTLLCYSHMVLRVTTVGFIWLLCLNKALYFWPSTGGQATREEEQGLLLKDSSSHLKFAWSKGALNLLRRKLKSLDVHWILSFKYLQKKLFIETDFPVHQLCFLTSPNNPVTAGRWTKLEIWIILSPPILFAYFFLMQESQTRGRPSYQNVKILCSKPWRYIFSSFDIEGMGRGRKGQFLHVFVYRLNFIQE